MAICVRALGLGRCGAEQIACATKGDLQRCVVEKDAESVAHLNGCKVYRVHARDTYLPQGTKGLGPKSESLCFLVTPTMRSWNQFSAFIEEWDELRTLAA